MFFTFNFLHCEEKQEVTLKFSHQPANIDGAETQRIYFLSKSLSSKIVSVPTPSVLLTGSMDI
jgi:hypothetical protein